MCWRGICANLAAQLENRDQHVAQVIGLSDRLAATSTSFGYYKCLEDVGALFPGIDLRGLAPPSARQPAPPPPSGPSEPAGEKGP